MLERTRKILFFTINDYWFDKERYFNNKNNVSLLWTNEVLDKKKYNLKIPLKTVYIDLTKSIDDLFLDFKKKSCRYEIRKSLKLNFSFNIANSDNEIKSTYNFFIDFCKKKKIPTPKFEEWKQMKIFYVKHEWEILSVWAFISDDKNIIRYKHWGSSYKYSCMEYMIFEIMKYAKKEWYKIFDMWWINRGKYPAHYKFKTKFWWKEWVFFCYIKWNSFLINFLLRFIDLFVKVFFQWNWNKFINFLNFLRIIK